MGSELTPSSREGEGEGEGDNSLRPIDILIPGRRDAIKNNRCSPPPLGCGGPAVGFRDPLSRKEFHISGLCQECQDKVFGGDDE